MTQKQPVIGPWILSDVNMRCLYFGALKDFVHVLGVNDVINDTHVFVDWVFFLNLKLKLMMKMCL